MRSAFQIQQSFTFPESTLSSFPFSSIAPVPIYPPSLQNPMLPMNLPENSKFPNINAINVPPPPPSTFEIDYTGNATNDDDLSDNTTHGDSIRNQIEIENGYLTEKKQILSQLHQEYDTKLRRLKQEIIRLKQKYEIVHQNPTQNAIQNILEQKQRAYERHQKQQMARSEDQQQLQVLCAENNNLRVIVETLHKQLKTLVDKVSNSEQANYPQDDSMISYAMSNNTFFQDILKDNRRLERQIKFMKHIIQRETQRNNNRIRKL